MKGAPEKHRPLADHGAHANPSRAANLPVVVWTVDRPMRMRTLLRAGVAAVITNRPSTGVQVREMVEAEQAESRVSKGG